ncbi:hypothetical protein FA95DRAFT_979005 [Auriscalpium vulgare]|uniref:Uncharacterized protein n=1 Tax=Auriscalpium vulgare TaxID=40419 RepID=A0ACB8RZF4_9AGAM|nr:hypothetical protein FA95DRAFT_979005 [Auriscalpium vulgare]
MTPTTMVLSLPLVSSFFPLASASPVANLTMPIPDAMPAIASTACSNIHSCRTLSNIISSCLATIFACIWTAVHRNIPPPNEPQRSRLRSIVEKVGEALKIVAVTLLVPEWVLSCAIRQRLHAGRLGAELEGARGAATKAWEEKKRMRFVAVDDGGNGNAAGARDDGEVAENRERMVLANIAIPEDASSVSHTQGDAVTLQQDGPAAQESVIEEEDHGSRNDPGREALTYRVQAGSNEGDGLVASQPEAAADGGLTAHTRPLESADVDDGERGRTGPGGPALEAEDVRPISSTDGSAGGLRDDTAAGTSEVPANGGLASSHGSVVTAEIKPVEQAGRADVEEAEAPCIGGFEGKIARVKRGQVSAEEQLGRLDGKWATRHGFFIIMGGFHAYDAGKPTHPLSTQDIVQLVAAGELIPPTEEEIQILGQGDGLSKGLAVLQTLWFVGQCMARLATGLPLTELEVVTLAYTMITVAMYIVWWDKPQNVGGPVRIPSPESADWSLKEQPERNKAAAEANPILSYPVISWPRVFHIVNGAEDALVDMTRRAGVPTFYSGPGSRYTSGFAVALALVVTIGFGLIHFIAWNSPTFPSHAETLIWRVCSIVVVAVPVVACAVVGVLAVVGVFVESSLSWRDKVAALAKRLDAVAKDVLRGKLPRPEPLIMPDYWLDVFARAEVVLAMPSVPLYVVARTILLVVSLTTLRSLPFEAYQTVPWTLVISHWH